MKIKATVIDISRMDNPNDKDKKKGLRYLTVVSEQTKKFLGGKTYDETLFYTIKSQDELDLEIGEVCIIDGKLWEMRTDDNVPIRGLTLNEIIKLAKEV